MLPGPPSADKTLSKISKRVASAGTLIEYVILPRDMYDNPLKPGDLDSNAFNLNVTLPAYYNYTTKSLKEWNAEVGNSLETK
jgi:hypothetical protein